MIRFYIGTVNEVLENHVINFNVDTLAESLQPPPQAVPLTKLTRFPQEGDEVFIIQPDSDFEIFFYTITPDSNFDISLNYGPAFIRITQDSNEKYHISGSDSQGSTFEFTENKIELVVNNDNGNSKYSQDATHTSLEVNGRASIKFDSSSSGTVEVTSGNSNIKMSTTDVMINGHLKVTI